MNRQATGHANVALLRGINVSGRNMIPMAELRAECAKLGWTDVKSYIQSGNIVFRSAKETARLEAELETVIMRCFDLRVPVMVRTGDYWNRVAADNPFPEVPRTEAKLVMLALSKNSPAKDAVDRLRERALPGEAIERVGDALWIHFGGGVSRSKLTPVLLDRAVGSPVTMRNLRTVLALRDMLG